MKNIFTVFYLFKIYPLSFFENLSKAGYIGVTKTFRNKRPCTICRITPEGMTAFEEYVEAIKSYIQK